MNGESAFGWIKVLALLVVTVVLGTILFKLKNWIVDHNIITEKLNPVSDKNIFYQGANAAVDKVATTLGISNYEDATIGTRIMDFQEAYIYNPVTQEVTVPIIGPAFNFARNLGVSAAKAVAGEDVERNADNGPPEDMGYDPLSPFQHGA
jgi:hypothetical protein